MEKIIRSTVAGEKVKNLIARGLKILSQMLLSDLLPQINFCQTAKITASIIGVAQRQSSETPRRSRGRRMG
ncbi:MAG: hypothetical protein MJ078_05505 [Clostridia bacterium]|nr:hypothetical protein [Clostridia bacterium]